MTKTFEKELLMNKEVQNIADEVDRDRASVGEVIDVIKQEFKNWHSDEEFQRAKRMLEHVQVENEVLKAQIKPPPVIPQFVAEMIEYAKNNKKTIRWFFTNDACMFREAVDWYGGDIHGLVDDIYAERQQLVIDAFITGKYIVEKERLFYLKNKMTEMYLAESDAEGFHETFHKVNANKFIQHEIDSMQAGSYEKIEVVE